MYLSLLAILGLIPATTTGSTTGSSTRRGMSALGHSYSGTLLCQRMIRFTTRQTHPHWRLRSFDESPSATSWSCRPECTPITASGSARSSRALGRWTSRYLVSTRGGSSAGHLSSPMPPQASSAGTPRASFGAFGQCAGFHRSGHPHVPRPWPECAEEQTLSVALFAAPLGETDRFRSGWTRTRAAVNRALAHGGLRHGQYRRRVRTCSKNLPRDHSSLRTFSGYLL